jgi:hypothetical protein
VAGWAAGSRPDGCGGSQLTAAPLHDPSSPAQLQRTRRVSSSVAHSLHSRSGMWKPLLVSHRTCIGEDSSSRQAVGSGQGSHA